MIRKATIQDIKIIHKLLGDYAAQGRLLPRSLSELYDHLRDFFVMDGNEGTDSPIAVCALGICWEDLAEIRSLAVTKECHGRKIGSKLVLTCLDEAKSLGIRRVFALTYIPEFFRKIGFIEIDKSALPHKIWADCIKCPKFPDCDEIAMLMEL